MRSLRRIKMRLPADATADHHPRISEPSGTVLANDFYSGRTLAITGGSGSFGRAFTRFLLGASVRSVRLIARNEHRLAEAEAEFADERIRSRPADVRDREALRRRFEGCDYVIHAAAMKRVEKCEESPDEAVKTNVLGAMNVVEAAIDAGVKRVVALSTDKASSPLTLYGATKLTLERLMMNATALSGGRAEFVVTRYGNVIGSRGSVVPLWLEQAKSPPLTLTHKDATRFWMTMREAVALVDRALQTGRPGLVIIPRLPSVRMADVAEAIAPGAQLRVIGMRGSEKVDECLISHDEAPTADHWGPDLCLGLPEPRGLGRPSYDSRTSDRLLSVEEIRARIPTAMAEAM